MEVAVMAGFLTEGDVQVNAGHTAKVRYDSESGDSVVWTRIYRITGLQDLIVTFQ